ncbi:MAG: LPXTG cell wall anchor domain-containing protein, partial [Finegoldia magna]|nr:LPXTG cell wall anchor domain-containing protein [Finegoldia magna]
ETPNEDPKETPWTPLTPAEEVTPQTPNDNETPKDEPKETPKEDTKETPKYGSKENLEKPTKKQSKKLPKAGADYELLQLAAGALTLVSGMGISLSRKKRD